MLTEEQISEEAHKFKAAEDAAFWHILCCAIKKKKSWLEVVFLDDWWTPDL